MASFETSPTKLLLISAAASLAALGIVMVASSVPAPPVEPEFVCAERMVESPPPAPAPTPIVVEPRPLPPPSK